MLSGDASWQLINAVLCLGMVLGFSPALDNEITGGSLARRFIEDS